jgi:hypothetical protein
LKNESNVNYAKQKGAVIVDHAMNPSSTMPLLASASFYEKGNDVGDSKHGLSALSSMRKLFSMPTDLTEWISW